MGIIEQEMNCRLLHKELQVRDQTMVVYGQVWCLREDIEKEEQSTKTLIRSSDHKEDIALV